MSETEAAPLDAGQLAELFTRHRAHLQRMVEFRMDPRLRQRIDSGDVLQEAYVNAINRLPNVADKLTVPVLVWLRQVTEQTLIDLQRFHLGAQQRAANREMPLQQGAVGHSTSISLAEILAGDDSTPSQKAMRVERRALIEQALDKMDPIDREVLALRHFEEMTNQEVCEILNLQPTAASNRYIRALQRLKEIIQSTSALLPGS